MELLEHEFLRLFLHLSRAWSGHAFMDCTTVFRNAKRSSLSELTLGDSVLETPAGMQVENPGDAAVTLRLPSPIPITPQLAFMDSVPDKACRCVHGCAHDCRLECRVFLFKILCPIKILDTLHSSGLWWLDGPPSSDVCTPPSKLHPYSCEL